MEPAHDKTRERSTGNRGERSGSLSGWDRGNVKVLPVHEGGPGNRVESTRKQVSLPSPPMVTRLESADPLSPPFPALAIGGADKPRKAIWGCNRCVLKGGGGGRIQQGNGGRGDLKEKKGS